MRLNLFTVVVDAGEVALASRDGSIVRSLPTGRHPRAWRETYRAIDLTERLTTLAVQEVPTAEGVTVRVSAAVRWQVSDAAAFVSRTRQPEDLLYLEAQLALRTVLADLTLDQIARAPRSDAALGDRARDLVNAAVAPIGVTVLTVVARDVILPAEVRQANLELITARSRGQAQLETARAETAVVRTLANAARVLDASPALAQLRLVQSVPYGAQVKLQLPTPRTEAE